MVAVLLRRKSEGMQEDMAPPPVLKKWESICLKETPNSVTSISTVEFIPQPLENKSHFICNRLFIGGFPAQTTSKELAEVFAGYGTVIGCNVMHPDENRNYGFVTFKDIESAEQVLEASSKRNRFQVHGYTLKIRRAVFKPKKNDGLGSAEVVPVGNFADITGDIGCKQGAGLLELCAPLAAAGLSPTTEAFLHQGKRVVATYRRGTAYFEVENSSILQDQGEVSPLPGILSPAVVPNLPAFPPPLVRVFSAPPPIIPQWLPGNVLPVVRKDAIGSPVLRLPAKEPTSDYITIMPKPAEEPTLSPMIGKPPWHLIHKDICSPLLSITAKQSINWVSLPPFPLVPCLDPQCPHYGKLMPLGHA